MTRLKVSFVIESEGDPSSVLDGAIEALPELLGSVEAATGEDANGDENDVRVEEVTE